MNLFLASVIILIVLFINIISFFAIINEALPTIIESYRKTNLRDCSLLDLSLLITTIPAQLLALLCLWFASYKPFKKK